MSPSATTSTVRQADAVRLIAPILLIAATVAVYANSFSGVFLFDDHVHIVENERIHTLWPPGPYLSLRRPFVQFTFALNYALGGLETWGYHLVNVVIHVLSGLTLYGIVRRTIFMVRKDRVSDASAIWLSFVVALLWLVHPLQTQGVTYLIQRGESLMGLCYLLSLYAVIRGSSLEEPWRWYGIAIVTCAAGMTAKAVMVTAPILVLMFDRMFLSTSWRQLVRCRGVLHGCLLATWLALLLGGEATGIFQTTPKDNISVGFAYKGISPYAYAMTQPMVILHYLRLCFWPDTLCLDYQWEPVTSIGPAVVPAVIVTALLLATIAGLATRHWLGFAGAWFFVILSPTSSFVPIKDVIFEHRMYLPLASVAVVVVFGVYGGWRRVAPKLGLRATGSTVVAALLTLTAVVPLAARTVIRNRDYQSASAMWQSVLVVSPESDRAHFGMGVALYREGRIDEAIARFDQAIAITPAYADAHFNLGVAFAAKKDWPSALASYKRAAMMAPQRVHYTYALGDLLSYLDRFDEAAVAFGDALAHAPSDVELQLGRANALADAGRDAEAIEAFEAALALDGNQTEARINLGNALRRLGRGEEAVAQYRRVLAVEPQNAAAWANLGAAAAAAGRLDEAEPALRRALALDADLLPAQRALVRVLIEQQKTAEARTIVLQRLERDPADAWANRKLQQLDQAIEPGSD